MCAFVGDDPKLAMYLNCLYDVLETMLLPLLLNLGCNNSVETPMHENYL